MKNILIWFCAVIGVLCAFGGGSRAAETANDRSTVSATLENSDQVVAMDLNKLVRKVVERNTTVITDYLQAEMARINVKVQKGIFEPVFHTSVNYESDDYPNTTEDQLVRGEEEYSEDAVSANAGIKGLIPSGATWDLSFLDKRRTSSTIDKFRDYHYEYGNSLKLSLEQPLLRDFGKAATYAKIKTAGIESDIEKKKFDQKVMELIGATIRQYWKLYGTQEICRSWKQSLQISQDFLQDFERRAKEGKIPKTDLMEARCSIGLRKAEVYNAENKLIEVRSQLMTLLNVPAADCRGIELVAADQPQVDYHKISDPDSYIRMAYDNWPEYLIAKKGIEKEKIGVTYARNQVLPRLNLVGNASLNSLDKDANTAWRDMTDGNYVSWFLGMSLELPVFGNTVAKNELLIARMRERQAAVMLDTLKTGLGNAIIDRIDQVNRMNGQVEEYQKVWSLRSNLLEIERTKLQYGRISLNDLLEHEEDCIDYQRQLLNAIVNYKLSEAELDIAVGNILTKYGIKQEDIRKWINERPDASGQSADPVDWFGARKGKSKQQG